ncbi:helix-turn-helix transcriptional regulator [Candidatus Pacearchaeota archaeon]|nr:helix-turn-helix transcriptional regulator [Candidatus Pacearchaeota archaeon]
MANTHVGLRVEFKNRLGETRVIKGTRTGLRVERVGDTVQSILSPVIAKLLGKKIRKTRKEKGLTLKQVGDRAGFNFPKTRMFEIETAAAYRKDSNPQPIKMSTLYAIAYALKTTPQRLLPSMRNVMKESGIQEATLTRLTSTRIEGAAKK